MAFCHTLWSAVLLYFAFFHVSSAVADAAREIFDFVIVGGGTAGLVVASRLAEHRNFSVLVIEYGTHEKDASMSTPGYFNKIPSSRYINVTSAPQQHLHGQTYSVVVGGTLGGGSSVNRLFFSRGSRYFLKSTNFTPPCERAKDIWNFTWDERAWGKAGPIHVTFPPFQWETFSSFRNAFAEVTGIVNGAPIPHPIDGNTGSAVGALWVPASQDGEEQTRSSAVTGYYEVARRASNFKLMLDAKVTRVVFENKVAVGVEVLDRQTKRVTMINARREVALAAGAINTPNILQKSGVGLKSMLEEAKITVVHELPGVGMNFQDTPTMVSVYNLTRETTLQELWADMGKNAAARIRKQFEHEYSLSRSGPLTMAQASFAGFLALPHVTARWNATVASIQAQDPFANLPSLYVPSVRGGYQHQRQIILEHLNSTVSAAFEFPLNGRTDPFQGLLLKPLSRGTVTLNTSDPDLGPLVDYRALSDPGDRMLIAHMMDFTRALMSTATLEHELGPVAVPEPSEDSDSMIDTAIRKRTLSPSCSHQCGTCAMLPLHLGGVVDDQLMVYGVSGLSIVDSSILPMLPGARLGSTVFAVAEKAADIILLRHRTG
ncbi:hypothetical protein CBER1_11273 [Cercospora berteroae]|uniref:Glucose-methanol-choline oxidoreductase N-terminal domain-containing protein n=1 Tax=Cercospora berteroae TaxID=357750 RepID=A0A2S6BZY3_9PEZI|nr:hypothetical protein CBER1_11273 [Cercospora berteroae]